MYDNNDSLIGKDIVIEDAGKTGGVTALMHVYPRLSNVIQPSLTFGVGTSLDLNYSPLFGGSIMFGRENRFALSGGYNFSNVKVVSAKYPINGHFERLKPDVVTLDTYNRFKRGGFLSVTYSLGLTKKTQEATATAPSKTEEKKPEKEKLNVEKPKDEKKEETKKLALALA